VPASGHAPQFDIGHDRLVGHGSRAAIKRFHPDSDAALEEAAAATAAAQLAVDAEHATRPGPPQATAVGAGAAAAPPQQPPRAADPAHVAASAGALEPARAAAFRRLARIFADPRAVDAEERAAADARAGAVPSARVRGNEQLQSTLPFHRTRAAERAGAFTVLLRSGLYPAAVPFPLDLLRDTPPTEAELRRAAAAARRFRAALAGGPMPAGPGDDDHGSGDDDGGYGGGGAGSTSGGGEGGEGGSSGSGGDGDGKRTDPSTIARGSAAVERQGPQPLAEEVTTVAGASVSSAIARLQAQASVFGRDESKPVPVYGDDGCSPAAADAPGESGRDKAAHDAGSSDDMPDDPKG